MNEVWLSKIAKKGATLIVGEKGRREQRWADCEIFQSESSPDKIESDPVLICKIFENHQSDPDLIHQCKIMCIYFVSVWYLDDGFIGGDPQIVLSNAAIIRNGLSSVGLKINNSKCVLLIVNNTTSQARSQTTKLFQDVFPSISIPAPNLQYHGSY